MPSGGRPVRVVADTNAVISGLFWLGPPRTVLEAARAGAIRLFTSPALLAELDDVLSRPKFTARLASAQTTPKQLVFGFAALAHLVTPAAAPVVVLADPGDDAVLACAAEARAQVIVSGDIHLRALGEFQGIPILTPAAFVAALLVRL